MSKSDTFEQGLEDLVFLNTNLANIGDATGLRGSTTAGSFYISLHTADPGEAGSATTSEATYTGYARVAVARSGSGWSRSTSTISNVSAITFGACTAGTNTITHVGITGGTTGSGAAILVYSAALSASLSVSSGITPQFAAGALTITED